MSQPAMCIDATLTQKEWLVEIYGRHVSGVQVTYDEKRRFVTILSQEILANFEDQGTATALLELGKAFARFILDVIQQRVDRGGPVLEDEKAQFIVLVRDEHVINGVANMRRMSYAHTMRTFARELGFEK